MNQQLNTYHIPQCDFPYHLECLDPPLSEVPEGEWFCPKCEQKPGEDAGGKKGSKRAYPDDVDEDDDFDEDGEQNGKSSGRKRKEAPQAPNAKPKGR